MSYTIPATGTLSTTITSGNATTWTATTVPYPMNGTRTNGGYSFSTGYNMPNTLKVSGDAEIEGELKLQGVSLSSRLDKIEERLGILRPNDSLEEKWEELKALGERYRELEKEILEKEKIWDLLKR
jgi:hypothetical protein